LEIVLLQKIRRVCGAAEILFFFFILFQFFTRPFQKFQPAGIVAEKNFGRL
jgi:hypothetical protein